MRLVVERIDSVVRTLAIFVAIPLLAACQTGGDRLTSEPGEGNSASVLLAVHPADGKIELTYEFETPVREFRFRYRADAIRDGSWAVLDPDIELVDGSVRHDSGEVIETVRLEVSVDSGFFGLVWLTYERQG